MNFSVKRERCAIDVSEVFRADLRSGIADEALPYTAPPARPRPRLANPALQ